MESLPVEATISIKFLPCRHYTKRLMLFPPEYIYEPWKAPVQVQKGCICLIGRQYPIPILDHQKALEINAIVLDLCLSKPDEDSKPAWERAEVMPTATNQGYDAFFADFEQIVSEERQANDNEILLVVID